MSLGVLVNEKGVSLIGNHNIKKNKTKNKKNEKQEKQKEK